MRGYKTVFFEPEIRVKMLAELVYPVISRSAWQTEDKIRALFKMQQSGRIYALP